MKRYLSIFVCIVLLAASYACSDDSKSGSSSSSFNDPCKDKKDGVECHKDINWCFCYQGKSIQADEKMCEEYPCSESCKDKNTAESCGDGMICDPGGSCVEPKSYQYSAEEIAKFSASGTNNGGDGTDKGTDKGNDNGSENGSENGSTETKEIIDKYCHNKEDGAYCSEELSWCFCYQGKSIQADEKMCEEYPCSESCKDKNTAESCEDGKICDPGGSCVEIKPYKENSTDDSSENGSENGSTETKETIDKYCHNKEDGAECSKDLSWCFCYQGKSTQADEIMCQVYPCSERCKDKKAGESCDDGMICDPGGSCIEPKPYKKQ